MSENPPPASCYRCIRGEVPRRSKSCDTCQPTKEDIAQAENRIKQLQEE